MTISEKTIEIRKARMQAAAVKDRADWQQVEDEHVSKIASAVLEGKIVSHGEIGKNSPTER